jgi:hypothetical protein
MSNHRYCPDDWLKERPGLLWKREPVKLRFLLHELKGALLGVWYFYWLSSDSWGVAFPSAKTISRYTGYSTKIVMRARRELVKAGWLYPVSEQQRVGSRFGAKYFLVVLPEREILRREESSLRSAGNKVPISVGQKVTH